jgi:hypothetical protein
MRKTITSAAVAALVALPLIAGATNAGASCRGRANTGTVIGGVGGALVGNSISRGGAGAVIGGLGGAVLGHQIAKSGCHTSYSRHAYYRRHGRTHYASSYRNERGSNQVYYDQNGNPVYRR